METSRAYLPDALERMTTVLQRAAQELNLARAPAAEKERLAVCILSIGNTYTDVNRLLEKSVRIYLRSRTRVYSKPESAFETNSFV